MLPLADAVEASSNSVVAVVSGLSALGTLYLIVTQVTRSASGKDTERQVAPTQLSAITSELKEQTLMLTNINREIGEVTTATRATQRDIDQVRAENSKAIEGIHVRLGGISRELAGTTARVDGLEKREGQK